MIEIFGILLLFVRVANAFVYSCEEIKYKLINSDIELPTRYVCLVSDNGFDQNSLEKIFARVDNVSISFANLLTITCAERPSDDGSWRIEANPRVNLVCNGGESTLIFSSTLPYIRQLPPANQQLTTFLQEGSVEQVFVSPIPGIKLHVRQCRGSGNVTVLTGSGTGAGEFRFTLKSWSCADLPDWFISFETVITVTVDADMQLILDYMRNAYGAVDEWPVSPLDRMVIMSSGLSDNLQNMFSSLNTVYFSTDDLLATVTCDPCLFDPAYNGYANLWLINDKGSRSLAETFNVSTTSNVHTYYLMEIEYKSDYADDEHISNRLDTFVLEISLSAYVNPTPPAVPPATDPYCACGLKGGRPDGWDTTDIWLDVVIIVDTTMREQALFDASILIESLIGSDYEDLLYTDANATFYTRMGVIAMSDEAQVLYNLNMTKSDRVLGRVHGKLGISEIDVVQAFNAAQAMLSEGESQRANVQQVIYYMMDRDPDSNPTNDAINKFKETGTIIVNDFVPNYLSQHFHLINLASNGFYAEFYMPLQYNYMDTMQFFCKANCFCGANKSAYAGLKDPISGKASGGCFHAVRLGHTFGRTESDCRIRGGLLASVHNLDTLRFINQEMYKGAPSAGYFWIGYSKDDDGQWQWEDNSTQPYTNWNKFEPSSSAVANCAYVDATSPALYWGSANCAIDFPAVCEFAPCFVGNSDC